MKSDGELMDILNAYDLTGSYRAAAALCGCSHHTVKRAVDQRATGLSPATRRARLIDDHLPKLEQWVTESKGKIRADKTHEKLVALGFTGTERTTRRALAEVKTQWRLGNTRVHRPWITEPGLWLQYDFGDGPVVEDRKVVLLVAWLAWCRYRVVIALHDRTAPSVFAGLDRVFRLVGGAPTYVLTDNEKTVTTGHVAGVPVRNRAAVSFGRFYGVSEPADPASKGGVENAVKLAKADIVPTQTNLLEAYATFADVEAACAQFMLEINDREHRTTRRRPVEMLAEERLRLHPLPPVPHTAGLGVTRRVPDNTPMITFEHGQYSVPATLLGQSVWVRNHPGNNKVIVCALDDGGPVEVARHTRTTPGIPAIDDTHFPGHQPKIPGDYRIRARTTDERAFLEIGDGARLWLKEAAAAGTERMYQKMAHAVELAALHGGNDVDWALGHAAVHGRFATGDLDSILA
ncbi:IS21/IS408/IS1162 family transposase, partial [Gordonia sp. NPDC003376]